MMILDFLDMGRRLHHKPQELSLGQLRRVSLARALLLNPAILLVDEPTNDLDPKLVASVSEVLLDSGKKGAAVVIVTHDYQLASKADAVFELDNGRLQRCEGNCFLERRLAYPTGKYSEL